MERLSETSVNEVLTACNTPILWTLDPFNNEWEVNCTAGQVRSVATKLLLGGFNADGHICLSHTDGSYLPRGRVILRTASRDFEGDETVDHIIGSRRYDDRLSNLRWASKKKQRENQSRPATYKNVKEVEISSDGGTTFSRRLTVDEAKKEFGLTQVKLNMAIFWGKKAGKRLYGYVWRRYLPDNEYWKPFGAVFGKKLKPGYLASSLGRIRSYMDSGPLVGTKSNSGYLTTTVTYDDGSRAKHKVHTLVCVAFHGDRATDDLTVDHIDRNRSNNKPTNLRWATRELQASNRALN